MVCWHKVIAVAKGIDLYHVCFSQSCFGLVAFNVCVARLSLAGYGVDGPVYLR